MATKKQKVLNAETTGSKVFYCFLILFMTMLSIVMLYPYLNVLAKAFNKGYDTMQGGITIFPRVPTLQNFLTLFKNELIMNSAVISIARTIIGTLLAVTVQYSAAYAIKKKNLRGKNIILVFLMIPMFFGGGLIPVYILYSKLSLLNSFLVYVLPTAFSMYNMVIIRTYLSTIPESFEESAKLDGANEITIMLRILLPLSTPILATITLWTLVYHWNDWTTSMYFITKQKLFTMQYVLMKLLKQYEEIQKMIQESIQQGRGVPAGSGQKATQESIQSAQIILTTIPIVLTYPFLQKYFIKGVMIGAIKE
jgi:putative aldouronate transport system permease protein